jgi:hypothetical protein
MAEFVNAMPLRLELQTAIGMARKLADGRYAA